MPECDIKTLHGRSISVKIIKDCGRFYIKRELDRTAGIWDFLRTESGPRAGEKIRFDRQRDASDHALYFLKRHN